jgi:catechol 2,3-dioxygenase-like lactoylglutathione lyase family enzyme
MAIMCRDPERLKAFYARWFGLEELGRTPGGTIHIIDGYFNIALMKQRADMAEEDQRLGLHHIGFEIESIDEISRRLKEFDPSIKIEERPKGRYGEYRIKDPEGIPIDLSEKGYGTKGERHIPGIRHIATSNKDPQRKFEFYSKVFGMRNAARTDEEVDLHISMSLGQAPGQGHRAPRTPGRPEACFAGDGFTNLAILPWPATEPRLGFNHFGFLVRNPRELMYQIAEKDSTRLDQRPADRFAEYRIWDPEGNAIDLSERKGFKVDLDKVERIED